MLYFVVVEKFWHNLYYTLLLFFAFIVHKSIINKSFFFIQYCYQQQQQHSLGHWERKQKKKKDHSKRLMNYCARFLREYFFFRMQFNVKGLLYQFWNFKWIRFQFIFGFVDVVQLNYKKDVSIYIHCKSLAH